ncbi:MAG: Rieske (2Fe-2S) protein [Gammaproteobacteria bacterium]|nr:MAG: Rieske (2Fe-2S) protein [Gammaproteobacteria bacterium]
MQAISCCFEIFREEGDMQDEKYYLCNLDDIEEGRTRRAIFPDGNAQHTMILVREGESVHGFDNLCPHYNLPLDFNGDDFMHPERNLIRCKNHQALFRMSDGVCIEGPCVGKRLKLVAIEIVDRKVYFSEAL